MDAEVWLRERSRLDDLALGALDVGVMRTPVTYRVPRISRPKAVEERFMKKVENVG